MVELYDKINGARLLIVCQKPDREGGQPSSIEPMLEPQFSSHDYGQKEASASVCWTMQAAAPLEVHFALIPISSNEDEDERRP